MYKCKICGKKYTELTALYNHIESKHKEMIPKDMSVQQYYYYMKTGKMNGNCVMCKQPTSWNSNTGKYNRFCGNPKCKDEYVKIMKSRMVAKYGKTHLLNDPNKQREMLANRSISGEYVWSDGKHKSTYTGTYELDFLKTLDGFFNWDPEDISMPSPHTYTYKYEGEDKFYIPDVFIHSLNLEIEIKDGGDNPNNHYKIQAVDKQKEALKDEVLCSQKAFHYIKITNKNYENFFRFLKEIKKEFEKYEDENKIPRIFKIEDIKGTNVKPIKESVEVIEENLINNTINAFVGLTKKSHRELDYFLSISYDLVKNNPKELQNFLKRLAKTAHTKDDIEYIRHLNKKSRDHCQKMIRKMPDTKDTYDEYYNWILNGGIEKDLKKVKIKESTETLEESYIIDRMEESSISIPQMTMYLQNEYEEEMRHYLNTYKKYYNLMLKEQPSAVKHINEDIRKCLIVIDGMADKGVENNLVQFAKDDLGEIVKASKHGKPVKVYESTDYLEEGKLGDNIDKMLIWLEKPKEKYRGGNITLYHSAIDYDKAKSIIDDKSIKSWKVGEIVNSNVIIPGATWMSKPRYGLYFWDKKEYAYEWGLFRVLKMITEKCDYLVKHGKCILVGKDNGKSDEEAVKTIMEFINSNKKLGIDSFIIYETEINIHKLEMTGINSIHEYSVSEPITITKKSVIKITEEMIKKHCEFVDIDEFENVFSNKAGTFFSKRSPLVSPFLSGSKDMFRLQLGDKLDKFDNPQEELEKNGNKYRSMLNKAVVKNKFGLDVNFENINTTNIIDCKLVYENPDSKQIFSLMDKNSKLIVEDTYIIQRDKVGTHCSVTPYYKDINMENVLEFTLVLDKAVDIQDLNKKLTEGIVISNLHKFNDTEYKFIKESCLKLFGVYPDEIKIK